MNEVEIAIFPIPGSVSFPFSTVPLHVFEPRYRKMIRDSIEAKRRIGIAHTTRVIAESKVDPNAPVETYVNANGPTYEPCKIFSAGFAELLDTLPDGRLMIQVEMDDRYELIEEIQSIPYRVFRCRRFEDESGEHSDFLRNQLDNIVHSIPDSKASELKEIILSPEWKSQSLYEYSFKIFSVFAFEPDILQEALECRTPDDRIEIVIDAFGSTGSSH